MIKESWTYMKQKLISHSPKNKFETIYFLKSVLIELKTDYGYDVNVIDKALAHLKYQEGSYEN